MGREGVSHRPPYRLRHRGGQVWNLVPDAGGTCKQLWLKRSLVSPPLFTLPPFRGAKGLLGSVDI